MNPYNLSLLLFSFCAFFVGLLVLFKRNDKVGKTFLIWNIFISGWGIATVYTFNEYATYQAALKSAQWAHYFAIFIPPSWLHFVYAYLGLSEKKSKHILTFYMTSALLFLIVPSPLFIEKVRPILSFPYYSYPGYLYHLFTIEFTIAVSLAFTELIKALLRDRSNAQLKALIFATFLAFLGGSPTFLPVYGIAIPQYNLFIMPIYPFIMAYAIIRQRLLDPDEVLAIQKDKLALLGLMTSSLNHEIKNPLFLLRGYAQKAKSGEIQSIDKMTEQIERIGKLTERLSEFSRSGSTAGKTEQVDIAQAMENALFFANHELKYHNIEISKQIDSNLPKLSGDKGQFEQILLNLIMNAFHAMPNGGELTIEAKVTTLMKPLARARGDDASHKSVMVSVIDTGSGIAKENLKNIFKPFYSTKGKQGTGLGLHIVKTLVEQNGGKISVESEVGKGTSFTLSFSGNHKT